MAHPSDPGLVGRDRELADLMAWMEQAIAGRGRLALLGGPPGIGKSRLVVELASLARSRDHLVLMGRGWADVGARPYWPWIQVLRGYLRIRSTSEMREMAGHGAEELAHLVPEIGISPRPAADEDPNVARFRLFDVVATFLRSAADRRPLVVIIEDLHAADTPSLLLLRFLVSQLADARMLVVGTYRDLELEPTDARAVAIDQLTRDPNAVAITLPGLGVTDSARIVAAAVGWRPDVTATRTLWRETQGNPLFLAHAARLLLAEGRLSADGAPEGIAHAVPVEVRDVILRRAARLAPDATRVLGYAAVLGPEFEVDMLRRLLDLPAVDVLRHLSDSVNAGLLADAVGYPGQYRFTHDLVRESLGEILPQAERIGLHRRIVETIERLHGDSLAAHSAALAFHALEAARGDPLDDAPDISAALARRALVYVRLAGSEALRSSAWEEAARLYRRAIAVGERAGALEPRDRFDLLMLLGEAEARAGSLAEARETFVLAVEAARLMGSSRDVAAAVIGYSGRLVWGRAGDDVRLVPLLEEALEMLGGDDDRIRARLLARLACALRGQRGAHERSAALSQEAVELARSLGDNPTLIYVLGGRAWAIWWPDNTSERIEIAREMLVIARRAGDSERIIDAHTLLALSYLELGQTDRARTEIAEIDRVAGTIRQPSQQWMGIGQRVAVELAVGNFDEAERLVAVEVDEDAPVTYSRDDVSAARSHRYLLARERGMAPDVEPMLRASVSELPWYPLHYGALANALLDLGRIDEARAVVEELAQNDFEIFVEDNEWLLGVSLAAEAIARLGDRTLAEAAYRILVPRAGRHAFGSPEGSVGVTDRPLGLLAAVLGDVDGAVAHLDRAVLLNTRMGLRSWAAHARADLADVLARRGSEVDAERARTLRAEALATARALGMTVLAQRLEANLADSKRAIGPHSDAGEDATFRLEGEYWTITYEGSTSRLRDARGLRHIARLIASPGQEIHALDLSTLLGASVTRTDQQAVESDELDTGSGAGPLLDAQAKAAYRLRLAELTQERAEAERWNDAERASRLSAEIETLTAELSAAFGLGGRSRSVASSAERARISVTRAIRSAIVRIGEQNGSLQRHFDATVRTGTFCSYRPDPRAAIRWDVGIGPGPSSP